MRGKSGQSALAELTSAAGGRAETATIDTLRDLVSRLEPKASRTLLKELTRLDRQTPRIRLVRRVLIEQLNQQRPHRAQRLFTSLFEHFLTRDLTLLTGPTMIPGVLTRPDVGALWQVLVKTGLKRLVPVISAELNDLARDQLVEEVMLSEPALKRRAEMAKVSLDYIYRTLAVAAQARELTAAVNEQRRTLLALQAPRFGPYPGIDLVRPLDRGDLRMMAQLLRFGDKAAPHIEAALAETAEAPLGDADAERQARVIERAQVAVAALLGPAKQVLSAVVPSVVLHVHAAHLPVALYIARRSFDPAAPMAGEALLGHYSTCAQGLIVALSHILPTPGDVAADHVGTLVVNPEGQTFLDRQLDRYAALLTAIQRSGLADSQDRSLATLFRAPWSRLEACVLEELCPTLLRRVTAVTEMLRFTAADHEHVVWLCRWVWRWRTVLAEFGYASQELSNWRDQIGGLLDHGMQTGARDQPAGGASSDAIEAGRLAHFARLCQIYTALDLDPMRGFSVTSRGMLRMCEAAFRRQRMSGALPSADERSVISAMVRLVRAEMEKTARSWVSAEHVAFNVRAMEAGY